MDEISSFNNIYYDIFSLEFDNLFSTIDFESFESKENDLVTEVNNTSNTTSTASERPMYLLQKVVIKMLFLQ